jgi:hypothetical protein
MVIPLGCTPSVPAPTDPNNGMELLKQSLEQWKTGKTIADLKAQTPSIIFGDVAWEDGFTLIGYNIKDNPLNDGRNLQVSVTLDLKTPSGKKAKQEVVYTIGTSPVITIIRE